MTPILPRPVALTVLVASACSSKPGRTTAPPRDSSMLEITCRPETADDRVLVRYQLRNAGDKTVHVLDSPRLPYRLAPAPHQLVVLHGVNPPDPDKLYNMIEIPPSRPLAPGETIDGELTLPPATLRDHYQERAVSEDLKHGAIEVRCEAGWGTDPITDAERKRWSIRDLLAWQQIAPSTTAMVTLP